MTLEALHVQVTNSRTCAYDKNNVDKNEKLKLYKKKVNLTNNRRTYTKSDS